jgi:hypothetical protein
MSVGDALSKYWTYGKIEDAARAKTGSMLEASLSPTLALDIISMAVQKIAKRLNGASYPFYLTTNAVLTVAGSANPYTVDLSSVAPFMDKIVRVVHKTTGGTRTLVSRKTPEEAEQAQNLSSSYSTSVFYVDEGDQLVLYKLSSFTITTATDTIELKYYRQPKIGTTSSASVVSDATLTLASDGLTVSAFTGVLASHLGGTLVGIDYGGASFARPIVGYISSTSCLLGGSALTAGAATNGHIIPPNSNTYTTTRGTYVDLPDGYCSLLKDEVGAEFIRYKTGGVGDAALEASIQTQTRDLYAIAANEKIQLAEEK